MGAVAGMQAGWFQGCHRQLLLLRGSRIGPTAGRNSFSVNKPASTDIFRGLCMCPMSSFQGHGKILGSQSGGKRDRSV